jgi:hypothetical protein
VLWCGAAGFGVVAAQGWVAFAPEGDGRLQAIEVVEAGQLRMIAPYAAVVGLLDPVMAQCCGGAIATAGIALLYGRDRLWRGAVGVISFGTGIVWCRNDDPLLGAADRPGR